MSDPKAHPEPTMEEILASIRRIISENDEEEEARKRAEAKGTAGTAGAAVLELTDMVTDDGTVVSLAAARQHEQIVEATAEENIPQEPDGGDRDAMEDGSAQEERAEMTTENPKDGAAEFARSEDAGAAAPAPGTEEGLVSADTASTATASFAELARSLSQEPATAGNIPLGSGRTLEDLVQEMIRPMLKAWLDQNLPRIVEQQVRREVNRMARRAENA